MTTDVAEEVGGEAGSNVTRPVWRGRVGFLVCFLLILCLVAGMIRISIPTRTDIRLAALPFEPLEVAKSESVSVPVPRTPDSIDLGVETGSDKVQKLHVFTLNSAEEGATGIVATLRDADSKRVLTRVRVPGKDIVNRGITTIAFPSYESTARLTIIELHADDDVGSPPLIQGFTSERIPGVALLDDSAGNGVVDVSVEVRGEVLAPQDRLRFMLERTLLRWPEGVGGFVILAAVTAIMAAASVIAWLLLNTVQPGESWRQRFASFFVVALFLIPTIMYVLDVRK